MPIQYKFDIQEYQGYSYVSAIEINNIYKKIDGAFKTTPKKLIKELKLDCYLTFEYKKVAKVGSITTRILELFKPKVYTYYLLISELEEPKKGSAKNKHIELLRLIELLPNIKPESI